MSKSRVTSKVQEITLQKAQLIQTHVSILSSAWQIRNGKDFCEFAVTLELIIAFN